MLPADNKIILTGELGKPASKCCPGPQANSHQSVDAQQHLELELLSPIPSVPSLSFPPLAAEMNTKLPSLGDFPGDYSFPLQFPMAQPGSYPPLGLSDEQQTPARIVHSAILHNGPTVVTCVNLFKLGFGGRPPPNLYPGLSKPAFSPTGGRFVVGTEEQSPFHKAHNRIFFSQLDEHNRIRLDANGIPFLWSHPVNEHTRDIVWVDDDHVLTASGAKMSIVRFHNGNYDPEHYDVIVTFPDFHRDAIREVAVNHINKNLIISGGFDGNVFVTDISKLLGDISKNEARSENSLYACREVVGSVGWAPGVIEPFIASCTTDVGPPAGEDRRRPPIIYDTGRLELFSHGYKDANTIFLGYGDGTIEIFDMRNKKVLGGFQDPSQKMIGDIKFCENRFATFGHPDETTASLLAHCLVSHPQAVVDKYFVYKTAGEWRKDNHALAVADSNGYFLVCDIPAVPL